MPITLGLNIASLKAQTKIAKTNSELGSVFEKLSSGMRINKASDDAAGLSIAESLRSDRRVFAQGVRNFNDGISLLNIADSAIESLTNIVVRLKELAEQSSNGTYSARQRDALDKEAQALSKEYLRITKTTKFNGINILDGSMNSGLRLQGGYGLTGSIFSGIGGAVGTGTFTTASSVSNAGAGPRSMDGADFNGDGIQDLVVGSSTGILIELGNGNGTFNPYFSVSGGIFAASVEANDFNGDGIIDIAAVDPSNDRMHVYIGRGNGSFYSPTTFTPGIDPIDLATGDFNGDGFVDIVTADAGASSLSIFYGNGSGTFGSRNSFGSLGDPYNIVSGDINGDLIDDIVVADIISTNLEIFYGGAGGFTNQTISGFTSTQYEVALGDMNGDGRLDILSTDYNGTALNVMLANSSGSFNSIASYSLAGGNTPRGIETGDFNGDGILDAATANYTSNSVSIFIGTGSGSFNAAYTMAAVANSHDVEIGDFNRDGVADLVSASRASNSLDVYLNNTKQGAGPLLPFDLGTFAGARQALPMFEEKLKQLTSQRGQLGAFQARVEVGINNLNSAVENYAKAESNIRDIDVAEETAKLVRLSILQKASAAVLAQANLAPQLVLKLLK